MRILFLSDNFPPETNAPANRLYEHARHWVRAGHQVTVVTCAPNFPQGRVHAGYTNRWYAREVLDGIDVVRVKTYIAPNAGFARRILDYLSFMLAGFLAGLLQKRPDVVVASSPQFFAAVGGWALACVRRLPFVFELRDLWPESIRAVGAMREGRLLAALEGLELFLYRRARCVVCVTEAFRENLIRRGIQPQKIRVVRGGVELEHYAPREPDAALASELGLEGKFVVGYLGTHGLAHALESVLEAATRLRERDDIRFLFVGDGAARAGLVELARERGLSNVLLLPPRPKSDIPALWSLCDFALIHLKDTPLFATVLPSKIFEAMGMGRPLLYAGPDGEAAALLRRTGAGVVLPAEDPDALARCVEHHADSPQAMERLALDSFAAAPDFDRGLQAGRMLEAFAFAGDLDLDEGELPEVSRHRPASASSPAPARAPAPDAACAAPPAPLVQPAEPGPPAPAPLRGSETPSRRS